MHEHYDGHITKDATATFTMRLLEHDTTQPRRRTRRLGTNMIGCSGFAWLLAHAYKTPQGLMREESCLGVTIQVLHQQTQGQACM